MIIARSCVLMIVLPELAVPSGGEGSMEGC
jgi:hypothetical protein